MTVKVKINYAGVGALLKSAEMDALVSGLGAKVAQRAGEDFACSTHNTGQRIICNIYPTSAEAAHECYEDNILLKALGMGG